MSVLPHTDRFITIGVMSGTSLDGVDLAACCFEKDGLSWKYDILVAQTIPYPDHWIRILRKLETDDALTLANVNTDYGRYLGKLIRSFMLEHQLEANLVASHGHTIFHQPDKGFTLQIGHGAAIAAESRLPVVCDFRSLDVALGGQGAPLVPIGDRLLFGSFDFCLNLGGFCNISYENQGQRIAFDISPCNIVLNHFAEKKGHSFDKDGWMASLGKADMKLLNELNSLAFYRLAPPKSLGKEWVLREFLPIVEKYELPVEDVLATTTSHIADQIAAVINHPGNRTVLASGGGALNGFLMAKIKGNTTCEIVLPDHETIHFKEALIFAFLGYLRFSAEINVLRSVTGSAKDHSGGCVYLP